MVVETLSKYCEAQEDDFSPLLVRISWLFSQQTRTVILSSYSLYIKEDPPRQEQGD